MKLTDQDRELIRPVALQYLKPPFTFNRGYIFDSEGHMVADDGDYKNHVCRIRGWGAIQYLENPEKLQDMIGELVCEALNQFWVNQQPAGQNSNK